MIIPKSIHIKPFLDMVGKLVEERKFDAADLNNQNVGSNYISGIYNVILSQGKNTKTIRVIKK